MSPSEVCHCLRHVAALLHHDAGSAHLFFALLGFQVFAQRHLLELSFFAEDQGLRNFALLLCVSHLLNLLRAGQSDLPALALHVYLLLSLEFLDLGKPQVLLTALFLDFVREFPLDRRMVLG